MSLPKLLLVGLVAWSGIGAVGVLVAGIRGERKRVRRGIGWLVGIWVVYMGVLVAVSVGSPQRVVAMGAPQCFGDMCFAVTRVEEVPGFLIKDGRRLVRVTVRMTNKGRSGQSDGTMRAYLVDAQGREWGESAGMGGVGLRTRVAGGDSVECEPVFKVAADASGLGLVLTRGRWQAGQLVIGDTDSLWHRRTVVRLSGVSR
jgi:hypothetical protein